MTRTLTIDVRKLTHSGIGRYLQNLLPGVLPRLEADRVQLLGDPAEIALLGDLPPNCHILECLAAPHSLAEQALAWDRRIPADGVLWVPHYNLPLLYRGRLVVTVHDLAPIDLKETFGAAKRALAHVLLRRAVRQASAILTPSVFTRDRLITTLSAPADRIVVTPLAVDSRWPSLANAPAAYRDSSPYLLFVGNLKPNKNLTLLLRAVELLGDECPYRILVAGRTSGFRTADEEARRLAVRLGDRVRLLGALTDDELISLYRGAAALVMPSLYEGFGLPLLEAMRYRCPVLCADATSLPEVAGDAALFFSPREAQTLAERIGNLQNEEVRTHLRDSGVLRESAFNYLLAIRSTSGTLNSVTNM